MAICGLGLQGLCSGLGAWVDSALPLLASRLVEGIGFLAVTVAAPTLIVHLTSLRDRGRAMAVWATFMPVGLTVILFAAPLLDHIGWRGFWLLNAGVLLAYAALVHTVVPATRSVDGSFRQIAGDVRETMRTRDTWILAGLFAIFSCTFFAVFGFLPSLLAERLGLDESLASVLAGVAVAAIAAGNVACGQLLARQLNSFRILLVSFVLLAVIAFGIFPAVFPGAVAYGLTVLFSFISGFIPVVLIDAAPGTRPARNLSAPRWAS